MYNAHTYLCTYKSAICLSREGEERVHASNIKQNASFIQRN